MWTIRLKSKMFLVLATTLIVADLIVGIPSQSQVSVVNPQIMNVQSK